MLSNPDMHIEISGHTDNIGSTKDNQVLSLNRANAVRNYLIARGITDDRLISHGYGETRPIYPNTSKLGRQMNRRTEFEIIDLVSHNSDSAMKNIHGRGSSKYEVWHMLPEMVHFLYNDHKYITDYSKERIQFDKPIASFQLIQKKCGPNRSFTRATGLI